MHFLLHQLGDDLVLVGQLVFELLDATFLDLLNQPPARDAVVITCAYLTDVNSPWVLQSLVLAAIGECNDRGWPALEGFGYRYAPGEPFPTRFLRHRTIFPHDFLADFGFLPMRVSGRVQLMRLDLRTLESSPEASRLARIKSRLAVLQPTPSPVR